MDGAGIQRGKGVGVPAPARPHYYQRYMRVESLSSASGLSGTTHLSSYESEWVPRVRRQGSYLVAHSARRRANLGQLSIYLVDPGERAWVLVGLLEEFLPLL